jgi:hypothetical protein
MKITPDKTYENFTRDGGMSMADNVADLPLLRKLNRERQTCEWQRLHWRRWGSWVDRWMPRAPHSPQRFGWSFTRAIPRSGLVTQSGSTLSSQAHHLISS